MRGERERERECYKSETVPPCGEITETFPNQWLFRQHWTGEHFVLKGTIKVWIQIYSATPRQVPVMTVCFYLLYMWTLVCGLVSCDQWEDQSSRSHQSDSSGGRRLVSFSKDFSLFCFVLFCFLVQRQKNWSGPELPSSESRTAHGRRTAAWFLRWRMKCWRFSVMFSYFIITSWSSSALCINHAHLKSDQSHKSCQTPH